MVEVETEAVEVQWAEEDVEDPWMEEEVAVVDLVASAVAWTVDVVGLEAVAVGVEWTAVDVGVAQTVAGKLGILCVQLVQMCSIFRNVGWSNYKLHQSMFNLCNLFISFSNFSVQGRIEETDPIKVTDWITMGISQGAIGILSCIWTLFYAHSLIFIIILILGNKITHRSNFCTNFIT